MKTLNFELSKRLNELGLLDDIETEYYYEDKGAIDLKNNFNTGRSNRVFT